MKTIKVEYIPTGTYVSEGEHIVLQCVHENYEHEDGRDGRVYCLDCNAVGFEATEQEFEGYDDYGNPEYGYYGWIEWITP